VPDDTPGETPPDNPSPDELRRQFEAAISGMGLDELRDVTQTLLSFGQRTLLKSERPSLRRPALPDSATFRVRVDLDRAHPPIWRTLDIRADATLDVVHQVLQAVFGWTDSHLHRFSLGGEPFDRTSELFLCPYDADEGEDEGASASEVRLDETMQEPGDVLHYVYDYGDSWHLTLRLVEVRPSDAAATAVCTDGRRAAPPEDCGGITGAADLAAVLDDPAHFDIDEVNHALCDPYFVLREAGVDARLVDLANRLRFSDSGDGLVVRLMSLTRPVALPSHSEMQAALRPVTWFLERAGGEGLVLTSAGYLKPADVEEVCAILPTTADWYGKNNRETNVYPLQEFRAWLQAAGLLRKSKGRLLTTRAGAKLRDNTGGLWDYLGGRLVPRGKDAFAEQSALLILAHIATSPNDEVAFDTIARMLTELGWRHADDRPLQGPDLYHGTGSPLPLLKNMGEATRRTRRREPLHRVAAALAHYALLRG
jgi:hypothetical protein